MGERQGGVIGIRRCRGWFLRCSVCIKFGMRRDSHGDLDVHAQRASVGSRLACLALTWVGPQEANGMDFGPEHNKNTIK